LGGRKRDDAIARKTQVLTQKEEERIAEHDLVRNIVRFCIVTGTHAAPQEYEPVATAGRSHAGSFPDLLDLSMPLFK
jgi:hypothetical protein